MGVALYVVVPRFGARRGRELPEVQEVLRERRFRALPVRSHLALPGVPFFVVMKHHAPPPARDPYCAAGRRTLQDLDRLNVLGVDVGDPVRRSCPACSG